LKDWDNVILKGNKKEVKFNRFKPEQNKNLNAAAALISGPPGIGKTSCVRIIAKGLSYNSLEFNASDCRSLKLIKEVSDKVSGANSLNFRGKICRTLLIMDEVDGMSSGDRGGVGAIVNMIKTTKVPIICICNDRQSQKLKTLSNYCLDLRFAKPNKAQILTRIQEILQSEGV